MNIAVFVGAGAMARAVAVIADDLPGEPGSDVLDAGDRDAPAERVIVIEEIRIP